VVCRDATYRLSSLEEDFEAFFVSSGHIIAQLKSATVVQRLSQECVFCREFGLVSGKVCQHPHHERGGGVRFGPVSETVVKRLKAKACQAFDEEKNLMHSVHYSF
jgi:hypothetical protein